MLKGRPLGFAIKLTIPLIVSADNSGNIVVCCKGAAGIEQGGVVLLYSPRGRQRYPLSQFYHPTHPQPCGWNSPGLADVNH